MQACGGFYVLYDEQHDPPGSIIETPASLGGAAAGGVGAGPSAVSGGGGAAVGSGGVVGWTLGGSSGLATRWGGRIDDVSTMRDE
jgi:hypothetical protein